MHRIPWLFALLSLTGTALSCTGGRGENGTDGTDCTVTKNGGSAVIECSDGTDATISDGKTGPAGANGADGENGADGFDGAESLLVVTEEPQGTNCPYGGTRIDSGLDVDADGALATDEIDATRYICDGSNGTPGLTSLVVTTQELAGSHCIDGGLRIDSGVDDNANALLDASEIDRTEYLCRTQCTVIERKISTPALAHVHLDYVGSQSYTENVLVAESSNTSDVVSYVLFDVSSLPNNSVIVGATLYLRHDPAGDTTNADAPTLRVLSGTVNRFTDPVVTTTSLPKGSAVSSPVDSFTLDGWNAIPLTLPASSLLTDRDDDRLLLGLDEMTTNNGSHLIAFYGSADAATRPYVEFSVVSCEPSP